MKRNNMRAIRVEERSLEISEYQVLRAHTDWKQLRDEVVSKALKKDLYSVVAIDGNRPVAMGRVIGDGAMYFYIQDIVVHKEYRNLGIGNLIMEHIENFLLNAAPTDSFIGLMAATGTIMFYSKFGYKVRDPESPGMYKTFKSLDND